MVIITFNGERSNETNPMIMSFILRLDHPNVELPFSLNPGEIRYEQPSAQLALKTFAYWG